MVDTPMIAAISLMRRRPDLTFEQFRDHWLDPHGTMTAALPGVRRYVQHHPVDAPGTNALAHQLAIDGIPELWFDDNEARRIAYTSPRIAACNVDSEHFVGAVTRLVTEPSVVLAAPPMTNPARLLLLACGTDDAGWGARARQRVEAMPGVVGIVAHRIIEQAAAPASRIPELKLAVGGIIEATFLDEATVGAVAPRLAGTDRDAGRTAIYRVQDHRLV